MNALRVLLRLTFGLPFFVAFLISWPAVFLLGFMFGESPREAAATATLPIAEFFRRSDSRATGPSERGGPCRRR